MEHLAWNKLLDNYLSGGTMTPDEYESLDEYQQFTIQNLKKAFKRINYKEQNENI